MTNHSQSFGSEAAGGARHQGREDRGARGQPAHPTSPAYKARNGPPYKGVVRALSQFKEVLPHLVCPGLAKPSNQQSRAPERLLPDIETGPQGQAWPRRWVGKIPGPTTLCFLAYILPKDHPALTFLAARRSHSFAVSAFVMVSWVVKVCGEKSH